MKSLPRAVFSNTVNTGTLPENSCMTFSTTDKGVSGPATGLVGVPTPGKRIMCERAVDVNSRGAGGLIPSGGTGTGEALTPTLSQRERGNASLGTESILSPFVSELLTMR